MGKKIFCLHINPTYGHKLIGGDWKNKVTSVDGKKRFQEENNLGISIEEKNNLEKIWIDMNWEKPGEVVWT